MMSLGVVIWNLLFLLGCTEKDTTFLITMNKVGKLEKTSRVSDLGLIYEGDSIVSDSLTPRIGTQKQIMVYEKNGKHLLTLTSKGDSIPTIGNIKVEDVRFVTDKGISLASTFKEIQEQYAIKKIVTTLNSVVIFPKASPLYFTIDKSELPDDLRYTSNQIDPVQIPDNAKLKYLMVGWD